MTISKDNVYYAKIIYKNKRKIIMKYILLTFIFATVFIHAEVTAKPSKPSVKPIIKPSFDRLTRDDYIYNPLHNEEAIAEDKTRKEEEEKMLTLEIEHNTTNKAKQEELQKKNKATYDKEMKAFENRKRSIKTENSIIISDQPLK